MEYIALSQALQEISTLMALMKEANDHGINIAVNMAEILCSLFEDNAGAAELTRIPKMRPHAKHLNLKYHHFREHVCRGLVSIHDVGTDNQITDILMKPLNSTLFTPHQKCLIGW